MKTKAAILWEPHTEWSIEEIDLDPPKEGEVLVQIASAGLCHSDEHFVTGDLTIDPEMAKAFGLSQYPMIGGHEGAGEILEVGPGVSNLAPGDHVVFSFIPACGRCPSCADGQQHLCDFGAFILAGLQVSDGTARHHASNGTALALNCCLGTFAPYSVVNEASCIKVEKDIPLEKAALVGCGVTTGWGAATYAADVRSGETVVVVGVGGIGMSAIQGAHLAGARHVIAVDTVAWKREQAPAFGATHTAASMEEALELVRDLTWGALADKAILAVGLATGELVAPLLALLKKGGRAVVVSISPMTQTQVTMNLLDLSMQRKELVGCIFGNANPRLDVPRLLRRYMEGDLKLDEMITRTYPLEQINQGYQDMRDGLNIRGVVVHDHR